MLKCAVQCRLRLASQAVALAEHRAAGRDVAVGRLVLEVVRLHVALPLDVAHRLRLAAKAALEQAPRLLAEQDAAGRRVPKASTCARLVKRCSLREEVLA